MRLAEAAGLSPQVEVIREAYAEVQVPEGPHELSNGIAENIYLCLIIGLPENR